MNFERLFNHLEQQTENNKNYYKEIHNVLYFNNEDFLENPDFLNENNEKKQLYDIKLENLNLEDEKIEENNFQKFSEDNITLFNLTEMNISSEYKSIVDCILHVINYKNVDGKRDLFERMIRDFDALKLYKKFNFKNRKICKKGEIRELLLSHNDKNEIMFKFLVHYLSVNMIIVKNDKYEIYSENDIFEPFKTTILLYNHEKKYYYFSKKVDNKKLFTSDDEFVMKVYNLFDEDDEEKNIDNLNNIMEKLNLETSIVNEVNIKSEKIEEIKDEPVKEVKEELVEEVKEESVDEVKLEEKVDYKKMKVGDLKKLCKEKGIKGYSKLKKKEVIELLESKIDT